MHKIEQALRSHGPSILEITGQIGIFNPTERDCVLELWNAYQDEQETSGYMFLVASQNGSPAQGYACFGPHPLTEGTYDLYWIGVSPAIQGHGVGHALMVQVEAEVRSRGGRLLLIETSSTAPYAAARRLYDSCGFGLEATIHDFYAPGDDLLIFAKHL